MSFGGYEACNTTRLLSESALQKTASALHACRLVGGMGAGETIINNRVAIKRFVDCKLQYLDR